MKKSKLNLEEVQVSSFVTKTDLKDQKTIAGGFYTIIITAHIQYPSGNGGRVHNEWKEEEGIWEN